MPKKFKRDLHFPIVNTHFYGYILIVNKDEIKVKFPIEGCAKHKLYFQWGGDRDLGGLTWGFGTTVSLEDEGYDLRGCVRGLCPTIIYFGLLLLIRLPSILQVQEISLLVLI